MDVSKKIELTREMKLFLLDVLRNGYIDMKEFEKAFGFENLIIDDPFAKMRKNHGITDCDCDNCPYKVFYDTEMDMEVEMDSI